MLQFLFDTDHLTLFQHGHPTLGVRLALLPPDAVGISAISVEESLRGRLAQLSLVFVNKLVLLTRNRHDFAQIPGLTLDDWSV